MHYLLTNRGDDDMTTSTWPQHPDGTNKRVGEMTADERSAVISASWGRFEASRGAAPRPRKITGRSLTEALKEPEGERKF